MGPLAKKKEANLCLGDADTVHFPVCFYLSFVVLLWTLFFVVISPDEVQYISEEVTELLTRVCDC